VGTPFRFGFRRRRILIPGFQLRYVAEHLAFQVLLGLAVAAVIFGPLIIELRDAGQSVAAGRFLWLHTWFWPIAITVLTVAVAHAVWISHRIAGPLYRFRRVFEQMATGDLTPRVRIREGDYLTAEAAAFDAALASLRERTLTVHVEIDRLQTVVSGLHSLSRVDRAVLVAALERLERARAALAAGEPSELSPGLRQTDGGRPAQYTSAGGFSVIELLIVAALVATLAAIGIPAYAGALERARITRAIADIRGLDTDLRVYQVVNSKLPALLSDARPAPTRDPWGRDYVYTDLTALKGKGKARKDRFLNPLNHDFDLYSLGRDGQSSTPLTAKASRDDVVRANDGGFIGLAAEY
jgi:general secretion pathway protein G